MIGMNLSLTSSQACITPQCSIPPRRYYDIGSSLCVSFVPAVMTLSVSLNQANVSQNESYEKKYSHVLTVTAYINLN